MEWEEKIKLLDRYRPKISELPTLPSSLVKLMRLVNRDDFEVKKIVEVISADQALTARILKIINSAFYGLRNRVSEIKTALTLLGQRRIASIIYTCSIIYVFRSKSEIINLELLWKHGFACALISEKISSLLGLRDPETAYICGLLRDFGIVAEIQCFPKSFRDVIDILESKDTTLEDAENEIFGVDHSDIGYLVAEKYNLPPDITNGIVFHHRPDQSQFDQILPAIVNVADTLCKLIGFDHGLPEIMPETIAQSPGWWILYDNFENLRQMETEELLQEFELFQDEVVKKTENIYAIR